MTESDVKNLLKQHLKVKVSHEHPHTFFNGYIKVGIYWDNELISEHTKNIEQSYF